MLLNENELMMKCSPIQHSTQLSCPHEQDLPDCCGILEVSSTSFSYSNIINVSLTYLRGLEIAELKEEDMPMV